MIADGASEILLSAASAWEVTVKHALGKLDLPEEPTKYVPSRLSANRMSALSIRLDHALRVAQLPLHYRDPFDRLLIAQAQAEDLTLITADPLLRRYNAHLFWAA